MSKMKLPPSPPVDAVRMCNFITASPTPFQAVHNLTTRLLSSSFTKLSEKTSFDSLKPGGKYYYTRNQSSLVAFTLPTQPTPRTAISFAVGHLDSPCLKIRPVSKKSKAGYLQVGVELYGGGIWHSWFDRDLGIAGRVIVKSDKGEEGYVSKLVKVDRPLLRIPTLAIHLERTVNEQFKFNKETEFAPILGLVAEQLNSTGSDESKGAQRSGTPFSGRNSPAPGVKADEGDLLDVESRHHPLLLAVLADELGCSISDIQDFELSLFDTQPSTVGGLSNEFVFSPRLDNLTTSYSTIEALCETADSGKLESLSDNNINCVILYDNEEVGSVSFQGAESNLLPSFVERIASLSDYTKIGYHQLLSNSFLISADAGHAVHPNYEGKYESNHAPRMNQGVVIKTNANQRYTSNAPTTFLLRRIAKKAGIKVQDFEIRNDSSCGSTVGPHLSTHVRTVDIGLAQLSMHSIRETGGSGDVRPYIDLFKAFFEGFAQIERELVVD